MELNATSLGLLIGGAAILAWISGRTLARRLPPWRRASLAVMVVLMLVIAIEVANNLFPFFPRGSLRFLLMAASSGWILGMVGCRD